MIRTIGHMVQYSTPAKLGYIPQPKRYTCSLCNRKHLDNNECYGYGKMHHKVSNWTLYFMHLWDSPHNRTDFKHWQLELSPAWDDARESEAKSQVQVDNRLALAQVYARRLAASKS